MNTTTDDKLMTLHVSGDLLSTNAESVRNETRTLLENPGGSPPQWSTFRLDLSGAKMVDSVGLNLIVTLLKRLEQKGTKLQVAYSNANVFRTFVFTRLDKRVELVKV